MIKNWLYLLLCIFSFTLFSCIKDELPNVEADIEDVTIPNMAAVTNIKIGEDRVEVYLKKGMVDLSTLKPQFTLSPNATIQYDGEILATTNNVLIQYYTVISEDKKWSKKYIVQFLDLETPTSYNFENCNIVKYCEFYEQEKIEFIINGSPEVQFNDQYIWASGNLGFSLVASGASPSEYPTFQTTDNVNGTDKKVACLVTRRTGSLGAKYNMPIAAGNLFLGEFSSKGLTSILAEPMKATRFGVPFRQKPTELKVRFKYDGHNVNMTYDKNGNGTQYGDGRDFCAVYAVFYDNKKAMALYGKPYLDGENILAENNEAVVAIAMLTDDLKYGTNNRYVDKTLSFEYRKAVDPVRLNNYEYSVALVFSASFYGDRFIGGIGNTLWVSSAEVVCE